MSSNVFVVLITGDTGDKVRAFLLFGVIGIGGELTVGNELVSSVFDILLQNSSVKLRKHDKNVIITNLICPLKICHV